jgi:hypothetical protein
MVSSTYANILKFHIQGMLTNILLPGVFVAIDGKYQGRIQDLWLGGRE